MSVGTISSSWMVLLGSGGSIGPFWDRFVEVVPPSSRFAFLVVFCVCDGFRIIPFANTNGTQLAVSVQEFTLLLPTTFLCKYTKVIWLYKSKGFHNSFLRVWSLNSREKKTLDVFATLTPKMTSGCQTTGSDFGFGIWKVRGLLKIFVFLMLKWSLNTLIIKSRSTAYTQLSAYTKWL